MNQIADDNLRPAMAPYAQESGALWSSSQGQVTNASVFLGCFLLCWLIVPLFYAGYLFMKSKFHVYTLTDQRFHETTGILNRQTEKLELYRVNDIRINEPFLQRLFGCGSITLMTSDTSTPQVVITAISNPNAVADLLRNCVERCRVAKGVRVFD